MKRVGDYEIVRKLGEGGMGSVFLARDRSGEAVVVKTPHRPTDELVARMGDEARTGFRLRHRHIVRTRDFFLFEGRPVLVIEWIDGASLKDLRDGVGRLPPAMVARVGEQISDALATIHHLKDDETGQPLHMLHRDVTPGNIIVDRAGDAKLIDLGIARSVESQSQKTAAGILRGTFRYLSPDLFAGAPYSWMTDLWALGVTLFEAALGRRAVEGDNSTVFNAVARGRLTQLREGEELHPMLRFLFDGLLAADAAQRRFRDPEEVLHAFRVIRGRLGDGEAEARALMQQVPTPTLSPPAPAPQSNPTRAPAPPSPPPASSSAFPSPPRSSPRAAVPSAAPVTPASSPAFAAPPRSSTSPAPVDRSLRSSSSSSSSSLSPASSSPASSSPASSSPASSSPASSAPASSSPSRTSSSTVSREAIRRTGGRARGATQSRPPSAATFDADEPTAVGVMLLRSDGGPGASRLPVPLDDRVAPTEPLPEPSALLATMSRPSSPATPYDLDEPENEDFLAEATLADDHRTAASARRAVPAPVSMPGAMLPAGATPVQVPPSADAPVTLNIARPPGVGRPSRRRPSEERPTVRARSRERTGQVAVPAPVSNTGTPIVPRPLEFDDPLAPRSTLVTNVAADGRTAGEGQPPEE